MNSILALFLAGGLLVTTLTGCSAQIVEKSKVDKPVVVEPVVSPVVHEPITDAGLFNIENEKSYKTVESLFRIVKKDGENNMISPLSLQLALGMAVTGASGETRYEIEKFMNCDAGTLSNKSFELFQNIDEIDEDSETKLSIANSMWVDKGTRTTYISSFEDVLKNDFRADIKEVVLSESEEEINNWAKEKTKGMIPKIVEDITPETRSILLNAVYFAGVWDDPFEEEYTKEEDFTLSSGEKVKVNMMSGLADSYFENKEAIAVAKEYEDGFSFVAVLPKKDVDNIDMQDLLKDGEVDCQAITLKLPKFKFDGSYKLNGALKQLGINKAFDRDNADFSNMSTTSYFISEVFQKTAVEMDEKGTKAAAVTGIMLETCSIEIDERPIKNVVLDRPFMFMILDDDNNILFYGNIENPNN